MALGIRPPGVKDCWEDCNVLVKAKAVGWYQTREHVRMEEMKAMAGAGAAAGMPR